MEVLKQVLDKKGVTHGTQRERKSTDETISEPQFFTGGPKFQGHTIQKSPFNSSTDLVSSVKTLYDKIMHSTQCE